MNIRVGETYRVVHTRLETEVGVDKEVVETDRNIDLMQVNLGEMESILLASDTWIHLPLGKVSKEYRCGSGTFLMLRLSWGLGGTLGKPWT